MPQPCDACGQTAPLPYSHQLCRFRPMLKGDLLNLSVGRLCDPCGDRLADAVMEAERARHAIHLGGIYHSGSGRRICEKCGAYPEPGKEPGFFYGFILHLKKGFFERPIGFGSPLYSYPSLCATCAQPIALALLRLSPHLLRKMSPPERSALGLPSPSLSEALETRGGLLGLQTASA